MRVPAFIGRSFFEIGLSLCLFLALDEQASAHVRSESRTSWEIDGTSVDVIVTMPTIETLRLSSDGNQPSDAELKAYLIDRVYPLSNGARCQLSPPIEVRSSTIEYRKFDLTFDCPGGDNLEIHFAAFFDKVASHVDFAQIRNRQSGDFSEQLLTKERQTVQVTGGEQEQLETAGFLEFVIMGMMHIFTGVDHMAFLIGLVMISRRLKDLVFVVSGFTIGHSLTLALAVTGILRPHPEYIDALVALTIALVGAENLAVSTGRPAAYGVGFLFLATILIVLELFGVGDMPLLLLAGAGLFSASYLYASGHLPDAGRLRLGITLVFGLIHGFGFAAGLLELQIPPERLAELLLGFNLGVEVGQLTLVLAVVAATALLVRKGLGLPRPIVVDGASSVLIGLGLFWFLTRI